MKKVAISIITLLSFLYIVYFSIALIINYEGVYQKFHKKMNEAGYDVKAESIDIVRFPTPRVELGGVSISNILVAKKLEIKFSLLSTMMFNPTIENIKVDNVNINTTAADIGFTNHSYIVAEIMKIVPKLPQMTLNNISLIDKDTKNINHIDSVMVYPDSIPNQLLVKWNDDTNTKLTYQNVGNEIHVQINSLSTTYSMKLSEIYDNGKLKSGALRYNIDNFAKFIEDRYNEIDLLITGFHSPESAELNCKIQVEGDKTSITNIALNSKSVSMTGNIDLYNLTKPDLIDLTFDFIDLKTLLATPNMQMVNESKNKEQILFDNIIRNINVKVKKLILADTELANLEFNSFIDKQKLNINKLSATITDGGEFNLSGVISQNQYRSMFDGVVELKHKNINLIIEKLGFKDLANKTATNFILTSKVKATPIDYQLNNLFIKMGSFNSDGNVSIKFIGNTPRINLNLTLSSLDLLSPNHPILSNLIAYAQSLIEDMKSKDYLKKYIALREINYLGNFDLEFLDPRINDFQIDKLHIISDVEAGNIILNSIYYQDSNNYMTGSGYIAASSIKPEIGFKISEAGLKTSFLDIANILKFFQSLQNDYDLNKVNITTELDIQNLEQNNMKFEDIKLNAKNNGILWNISALKGKYSEGIFDSSGSLRNDSLNLNLAYAYNDFRLKDISQILPLSFFGIEDGRLSCNGIISTNGSNMDEVFYNLYTKSSFIGKNIKWNNFGIDSLFDAINNSKYQSSSLDNDLAYYMNNGDTTMNMIEGNLELNNGSFKFTEVKFNTDRAASENSSAEYNIYNNKLLVNTDFMYQSQDTIYGYSKPPRLTMKIDNDILAPQKSFIYDELKQFIEEKVTKQNFYQSGSIPSQQIDQQNITNSDKNVPLNTNRRKRKNNQIQ